MDFQTAINLLKVDASELAVETVMAAMRATGLSGYRNDTDVSIGRALRDILSSPIMINNDRILASLSSSTLLSDIPLLHPGLRRMNIAVKPTRIMRLLRTTPSSRRIWIPSSRGFGSRPAWTASMAGQVPMKA